MMKKALVIVTLMVMLCVASAPKAEAGIPVIDEATIVETAVQAISWIQQAIQMQQQIVQAKQQYDAIVGSRNMGGLLDNLALAGVVPWDVASVYHSIRLGGINGLSATARTIRNNRMIFNCDGKTGEELRICQNIMNQSPQSQAYYANATEMLLGRGVQIRGLMRDIDRTDDLKASTDLLARLSAEQAQIGNDANRIATMKSTMEEEKIAAEQEYRELRLKNMSPDTHGAFETMAPWAP